MIQVISYKSSLENLAPVKSILGERRVVNLRALASDSRRQERRLVLIVLWGSTLVAEVVNMNMTGIIFMMVIYDIHVII